MASAKRDLVQQFRRYADRRFEEAEYLCDSEFAFTTGAVYLAGYSVECILKALLLSVVPKPKRSAVADSFRGVKAHDFEWLRGLYVKFGGAKFPPEIREALTFVSDLWSTDLRYSAGKVPLPEARAFLAATASIMKWADGRL